MDPKRDCRLAPGAYNPLTPAHPVINASSSTRVSPPIPSHIHHVKSSITHGALALDLPSLLGILGKVPKGYSILHVQQIFAVSPRAVLLKCMLGRLLILEA